jgi:hypothetical protein
VFTYDGGDGNEVVLNTNINRSAGSYFTTLDTLKQARDAGLFDPVGDGGYVPRSDAEITAAYWASEEGQASRAVTQALIDNAYASVSLKKAVETTESSGPSIERQSWDVGIGI